VAQISAQSNEHQTANTQLQAQVKVLISDVAALKSAPADTEKFDAQLKSLGADITH
jgi:hypothetical protein